MEAIADLGLAASIVEKVDITDCSPDELRSSGNYILPTIKTCDMELTGFPDVDTVRTAILQSMMKGCFSFVQASSHH
ncbi:MAG: hypothetical protein ACOC38_12110 [Promethearchaeia archaeon]